jgi:exodeoxyribonuclease V alpha subunit
MSASLSHTLRVATVRSQNPRGVGGCIFTGVQIDDKGNVVDATGYFVVRAPASVLGETRVQVGQWWRIDGEPKRHTLDVNGYRLTELQVEATGGELQLPSGEHIVTFMAESEDFRGIGHVKARKLWEAFGDELYVLLNRGDVDSIAKVLGDDSAHQIVAAWALHGDARTLQWLHTHGFETALGRKVVAYFGADTPDQIAAEPYRLLSFCATWQQVDRLARSQFGVADDDPRRLQGAIEEACYRQFGAGHTVVDRRMLIHSLKAILGPVSDGTKWLDHVQAALDKGLTNGSYVIAEDGSIHPLGPLVMELSVAMAVASRLQAPGGISTLSDLQIDAVLADFERDEDMVLNAEQRQAVRTAASHNFALIAGGAGVGKTTVLKALYCMYDRAGIRVHQVALAGRAAKRMQEATGRPAATIASFLHTANADMLDGPVAVVVDEASMVDIITASRLMELLPEHVRIVMVGDPAQLMPVGPGLVLHSLATTPGVPVVELKTVKRHGGDIATAALAVRQGKWPSLSEDVAATVAFFPRAVMHVREDGQIEQHLAETVFRLYAEDPENTQILSSRRNSPDGTKALNILCQSRLTASNRPLLVWSEPYSAWVHTGFHVGDPLLCTRNMWGYGLQNGSLGRLVEIEDKPRLITNAAGDKVGFALAWVDWDDGERRPIYEDMLDDLELGYAITTHKAQGSQWPRVIVAVTGSRLLDRTLLYTALTRAQRQVVLVGDAEAACKATMAAPRAHARKVGLGQQLLRRLEQAPAPRVESVNNYGKTMDLLT